LLQFRFTRPRGARLPAGQIERRFSRVSIHAPVKGATSESYIMTVDMHVSIHAPAWGATLQSFRA